MASLVIRGLDERIKERLRKQAAEHGRSMEAEARRILSVAVEPAPPEYGLASAIRKTVAKFDVDVGLEIPQRTGEARFVDLNGDT